MPRKLVRVAAGLVVALAYLWFVQCTGERFYWKYNLDNYYNLLGRAFAQGQLHLPKDPPPELLALADPWDPAQNDRFPMHDAVLFNKRYYLYHGATPALLLFTPWRLITGHDVTEIFAAFLFCFGGYLFASALLIRLLALLRIEPPLPLLALMLLAVGFCQVAPYLLQRVLFYEIAITCGYFCLSAGFYFFARALEAQHRQPMWLALAGLLLGLAMGCRPHLAAGAFAAGSLLLVRARRKPVAIAPFLIPVAFCGVTLGAYNYARFGNPFEFGVRYQLASPVSKNVALAPRNIVPGLYYLLLAPPEFEPVFPYVRPAMHLPFDSERFPLPQGYYLEPIAGALTTAPLVLLAVFMPLWIRRIPPGNPARTILGTMYLSSLGVILFIAAIGFSTERYVMDFLPGLLVISCVIAAAMLHRFPRTAAVPIAALIVYGLWVNLALGVQGPFDEFVRHSPESYVRLARWFSPVAQYRPMLNPKMTAEAIFHFPAEAAGAQPLVTAGRCGSRYALSAESIGAGKWRLVSAGSRMSGNTATAEVTAAGPLNRVRLEFLPESRTMIVRWNGIEMLRHRLDFLITAPSQMLVGIDRTEMGWVRPIFSGAVELVDKAVSE